MDYVIAAGPGFSPRVKVAPGRDGPIEAPAIPGQNLMSHTPYAQPRPPHEGSGLLQVYEGSGPSVLYLCFACVPGLTSRTRTGHRYQRVVSVTCSLHNGR